MGAGPCGLVDYVASKARLWPCRVGLALSLRTLTRVVVLFLCGLSGLSA